VTRTGTLALLAAAVLAGCGSSGDDEQPGLTRGQAQSLVAQLEGARKAAAARDVARTQAAIDKFRRSVAHLRRTGALSDATARSLRVGTARVLDRLESDNAPPAQPVATQTTPAPAPEPPGNAKKKGEKKHGKHGKHDEEGGD